MFSDAVRIQDPLDGDGTNAYEWDRANRLLSVTEWSEALGGVSYAYDGLNNRVSQTISSTVTQYLLDLQPGLSVVLAATTGAATDRYIHGPRGIHAQRDAADNWEWMVQDGLGSVRGVADASGATLWSGSYGPYGNDFAEVGTPQTMYGFTGEPTNETGLVHLRARDYNPTLGIFTALDPFEGIAWRPMSLNGYSWVEGNVVNLTDPSGNGPCVFCGGPLEGLCFGACDDDDPVAPPYDNTPTVTPCPTPFPFNTNTPQPTPVPFVTNTPPTPPTDTSTPSPTPTPSGTPISLSSVFGGRTAIPLLGATTAVYGAGHAAVDIVPEGSSNAAGASVYAVCRGEVRHKNKEGFRDNPYYNNVVEVVCTNPNRLIIYSHVCPNSQLGNLVASGDLLGTLAGLSAGSGECVDDGSVFPIYGASHLHFEVQDLSSGESVPPSEYLSECQGSNPPSWCAVASDFNQSYLPTPTPNQ